jgi:hypothetical protein
MLTAIQDFRVSAALDSGLLRADAISGKPIPLTEILSLTSMVQSLFLVTTLVTRQMDRIKDCFSAWTETAETIDRVLAVWEDVRPEDQNISWMLGRIRHFASLAHDRAQLYEVTPSERVRHAKNRDAEVGYSYTDRHGVEPAGYSNDQSRPAHIYSCSLP